MSDFTLSELKRLSEAATPGPWHSEPGSGDTHWVEDAAGKPIGEFSLWEDNCLAAYIGTHLAKDFGARLRPRRVTSANRVPHTHAIGIPVADIHPFAAGLMGP